jgi:hypothetical protein
MQVLREFESHRFRHLLALTFSCSKSVLSGSASSAATAIQCSGLSPNLIAKLPASVGLRRPRFCAMEIADLLKFMSSTQWAALSIWIKHSIPRSACAPPGRRGCEVGQELLSVRYLRIPDHLVPSIFEPSVPVGIRHFPSLVATVIKFDDGQNDKSFGTKHEVRNLRSPQFCDQTRFVWIWAWRRQPSS